MPLLRFHWDFFGPDAGATADRFLEHVDEFCAHQGITGHRHWVTRHSLRATATLECDQAHLRTVRDRLRPRRAEQVLRA